MPNAYVISTDSDIQGGTPCFAGTRVPVRSLFDVLKHGRTIDYFLSQFPAITAGQAKALLDEAVERLSVPGHAA